MGSDNPRMEQQRVEAAQQAQKGVAKFCEQMQKSTNAYYDRKCEVLDTICGSALDMRDRYMPNMTQDVPASVKDLSLAPWLFQSIAGSQPATWPDSLPGLNEKLLELKPLSLWSEPIEVLAGSKDFFHKAQEFITETCKQISSAKDKEEIDKLQGHLSEAMSALFGVAVLSGSQHTLIMVLDFFTTLDKLYEDINQCFVACKETMQKYLSQLTKVAKDNSEPQLVLRKQQRNGIFCIAKQISFSGMSDYNTSITTDGSYIYMYIAIVQRGCMYKVGTGENGTIAGKVYQSQFTDREGEVNWVYCQGKLYSRRANEPLSQVVVIDPKTLKVEGKLKLIAKDLFTNPDTHSMNRYSPLITDGTNIYLVTMRVVTKKRKPRECIAG